MSVINYDLNNTTTNINNDDNIINNMQTTLSLIDTNNSNPC